MEQTKHLSVFSVLAAALTALALSLCLCVSSAWAADPVAKIGDTSYNSLQAAFEAAVGTAGGDVTVEIIADIDGQGWTSVDFDSYDAKNANSITIEGNGHVITGLNAPLISGVWTGDKIEIRDLTVSDANIDVAGEYSAAFIARADSIESIIIENCKIINSTIKGNKYVGGFIGWNAGYDVQTNGPVYMTAKVINCLVENSTFEGVGSTGAIIGHAGSNSDTLNVITGTVIKNNIIKSTGVEVTDADLRAGAVIGTANVGKVQIDVTETNNTVQSNLNGAMVEITTACGRVVAGSTGSVVVTGGSYDADPIGAQDASIADGMVKLLDGSAVKVIAKDVAVYPTAEASVTVGETTLYFAHHADAKKYVEGQDLEVVDLRPASEEPKEDTKKDEQLAQTGDATATAAMAFCGLIAAGAAAAFVARRKA